MATIPDVELREVTKRFGPVEAVRDVSLQISRGEFFTLLGPSGCGKSTTLNMIAGFVDPTGGLVFLRGECVNYRAPFERNTAMVFQNYALFPHMTVWDNVAFGLRMRRVPAGELRRRVDEALEKVRLAGFESRFPRQLSGGQQQRVALARAIVTRPAVLLLDEPLSNLDLKLREAMRLELKALQRELGVTTLYVTHDQSEALVMSDRIAVMSHGRVEQLGTALDIYERPTTPFVAGFIGTTNLLKVRTVETRTEHRAVVITAGGLALEATVGSSVEGDRLMVAIRPEKIQLLSPAVADQGFHNGVIVHTIYLGSTVRYIVALDGGEELTVDQVSGDSAVTWTKGDRVAVRLSPPHCLLMGDR
ncbi:MAG: ABC transporter ATP-binding protein [Armatimonadota bacterium]|nr:ABC transporter ATP-binding protein [Armatimonadota bacterium]